MKHNKLSISIVSAFIAALGLTACTNIAPKDNAIVTIQRQDGTRIPLDTNKIYGLIRESEDGVTSFYNAILEVLIRDHFERNDKTAYEGFVATANNKVQADHKRAKNQAKSNNTSYDDEWQAILDTAGVKNEDELKEKYIYDLEKEEYTEKFFDNKERKAKLTEEYIGFKADGTKADETKNSVYPYHVRHILLGVDESTDNNNYVTSEISAEYAHESLGVTYKMLTSGSYTFGEIANQKSTDAASKKNFGDSGIMTTKTSFVNEFKLGIYAYDAIFKPAVQGDAAKKTGLFGLGEDDMYHGATEEKITDKLNEIGLQEVPGAVFEQIDELANIEKNKDGKEVNDGLKKYYPRNILWNNYLNIHNPFVITAEGINETNATKEITWSNKVVDLANPQGAKTGFRQVNGFSKPILTDEDGRVIIGVRSQYGIHLMVVERSPFETAGTIIGVNADGTYKYDTTSITDYYTTYTPDQKGLYPEGANTYVNHLNTSSTTFAERANTVKGEIKGFDKMYDYRLFETLVEDGQINVREDVKATIDRMIDLKREDQVWTDANDINNAWNTYLDKLELQYQVRGDNYGANKYDSKRLVKVTCAFNFLDGGAAFNEGGDCYYEK